MAEIAVFYVAVFAVFYFTANNLSLIEKYKQRYGFSLYAWVIMSNHVHLLIEVGEKPLCSGHVFEQRYKAILCNKEIYLLSLIRYIHQNPERARMETGIDYPYSSHRDYKLLKEVLTDITYPLGLFSENKQQAVIRYLDFMGEEEENISRLKPGELEVGTHDGKPEKAENRLIRKSLKELIELIAVIHEVEVKELISRSRKKELGLARRTLVNFCREYTRIPHRELAETFSITESAISKMLARGKEGVEENIKKLHKMSSFQA